MMGNNHTSDQLQWWRLHLAPRIILVLKVIELWLVIDLKGTLCITSRPSGLDQLKGTL